MKFNARVLAVIVWALAGAACDENLSTLTGPTPSLQPTLSSIQASILSASDPSGRLACIQCHSDQGRNPSGAMVLLDGRAYDSLVGRASSGKPGSVRVIPGDPDNGYLVRKLEGAPDIAGTRMPRGNGPFLTQGQMLVIRRWIEQGAKND